VSYKKIHGLNLEKVKHNFEKTYCLCQKHSPNTTFSASWHRYRFNEEEFWPAYRYFQKMGAKLNPVRAFLNDGFELNQFLNDRIAPKRLSKIQNEIFTEQLRNDLNACKNNSQNYSCPQFNALVISEKAELLRCCAYSRIDKFCNFGSVLEMSLGQLHKVKLPDAFCNVCIEKGIAKFIHNPDCSYPPSKEFDEKKLILLYLVRRLIKKVLTKLNQVLK
jgi:hypothetical protein